MSFSASFMRAMRLREIGPAGSNLELAEIPIPRPVGGQVLLRVSACGVCRTDLHVVEGDLPESRPGIVPGHQVVGRVVALGPQATGLQLGERAGIAWLHSTCQTCSFCTHGAENLCDLPVFTGYGVNGGFAEYALGESSFVYPLPDEFGDLEVAPLLCAGIIGFRCLRRTGLKEFSGARLGLYGFGAAGHVAIQIARARGAEVYVCTRDAERHAALAAELGATWVGGAYETPPVKLDASIIFAPAGELVPSALSHLSKGGTLVLGGIHMSPIPQFDYGLLYGERCVQSVANNTRADGREFLAEAVRARVRTRVEVFPLSEANEALRRLKNDAIKGAGVLTIGPSAEVLPG